MFCSAKNVQKIIPSDHKELLRSLVRFKDGMEGVMGYDHIQVPPVYKQVIPIFKTLFSFFRCASISCTDHRISLTDSLIETGDWQFCMFDSSRTTRSIRLEYLSGLSGQSGHQGQSGHFA